MVMPSRTFARWKYLLRQVQLTNSHCSVSWGDDMTDELTPDMLQKGKKRKYKTKKGWRAGSLKRLFERSGAMRSGYLQRGVNPITTSVAVRSSLKTAHFAASTPLFLLLTRLQYTCLCHNSLHEAFCLLLLERILKMIEMGGIKDKTWNQSAI